MSAKRRGRLAEVEECLHVALLALAQALEKTAENAYAVLQTLHISQRCLWQNRAWLRVVMRERAHAFLDVWREELDDAALGEAGDIGGAAGGVSVRANNGGTGGRRT